VPDVRRRLAATGELAPDASAPSDPTLYDDALAAAVHRFQEQHGLTADGVIGPHTREVMNVTAKQRVRQIIANMERLRWLPDDLGQRYVTVNVAGFSLKAVDHGIVVAEMPVVVGTSVRRTPVFTSKITSLIFNPSWTVPLKVAREDILQKLIQNPAYLTSQGIRVYAGWSSDAPLVDPADIDWKRLGARIAQYRLRQDPGPLNALGVVKFQIPNKFDVYLHDTPARDKFNRTVRTFSSGCVRVGDPDTLTDFLLRDLPRWDLARRQAVVESRVTETVVLRTRVPIYLLYQTAWGNDDGTATFRDDIYDRDKDLLKALSNHTASSGQVALTVP